MEKIRHLKNLPVFLLRFASQPLRFVPESIHSLVATKILTRLFKEAIAEGELDFLQDRILRIHIEDLSIGISMSLKSNHLSPSEQMPDVTMNGHVEDFWLLLTRQEDADSLFFQRRLTLSGDTELGLQVKNFLDAWEWDWKMING